MKKKLSTILILFIILTNFFAPLSVGIDGKNIGVNKNEAAAADDCKFQTAYFSPNGGINVEKPPLLTLTVKTSGDCTKKGLWAQIDETNGLNKSVIMPKMPVKPEGNVIEFVPGEYACNGGHCEINFDLYLQEQGKSNIRLQSDSDYFYKCLGATCNNSENWTSPTNPVVEAGTTGYQFSIDSKVQTRDITAIVDALVNEGAKTSDAASGVVSTYTNLSIKAEVKKTGSTDIVYEETQKMSQYGLKQTFNLKNLKPDTDYNIEILIIETINTYTNTGMYSTGSSIDQTIFTSPTKLFHTNKEGVTTLTDQGSIGDIGLNTVKTPEASGNLPECSATSPSSWFTGCIAQMFYYVFFKLSSFVFGLSGKALDFTLSYSISDTSYRSAFVTEGWGVIKDFCNMFFIFVLLYIAFGTILNLHSVKTKEMIINVVIIGLLINFSLFATQVIIDASNILTRVFYNQKTIITGTQKDADGKPISELGSFGEIKLSEAIVSKVNPQELIMNASQVESVQIKGTVNGENQATKGGVSTGTFIIVIFLATAVNVVGTIAFLSSALIFIGRVVMLWLAMILAPLAFFSYIVPQLQDIEMIGWKKWWPDTLKMAFVAPVFAFFMYIIVGFLDTGLGMVNASMKTGAGGLNYVIAIVVPFAFLMILLMKAKSIAVKMSGEVGAAMSKAGAAVGGIALGAATGGAAFAMRGTLGAMGTKLGESKWAKQNKFTRAIGDAGKWTGTKTFDARNTTLGKQAVKGMGIEGDIGKAKEGGYTKYKAEVQEKGEKRAKSLEVGHDEGLMHTLHGAEEAALALKNKNSKELDALTGKIPVAQQDVVDKTNRANALKEDTSAAGIIAYARAKEDLAKSVERVKNLKEDKQNISEGGIVMQRDAAGDVARDAQNNPIPEVDANGNNRYHTTNGKITAAMADKPVKEAEKEAALEEARAAEAEAWAAEVDADISIAKKDKDIAKETARQARTIATTAKEKHSAAIETRATVETGKSINDLDFKDIPDAKHAISMENSKRKNAYADERENRWFNKSANKHAAHNIRMNAEIKSEAKGGH